MRLSVIISALAVPSALLAQGSAASTSTTSTSRTQTFHTTNASAEVNTYRTRLTARVGLGQLFYDQSFNVPVGDAAVQAAIQQARALLIGSGAISVTGPTQQSSTRTSQGTSQSTIVNSTQETILDPNTQFAIGPGVQLSGDRGLCTGLTGAVGSRAPTGCPGGVPFNVVSGSSNVNININTQSDIFQTVTTTSTFLTAETYELSGTAAPAPAPPATPAPPSFWLSLAGLAAAGLFAFMPRSANS